MKRNSGYPMTGEELEAEISRLIATGRHSNGREAANPKPPYFLNFRITGIHGQSPGRPITIPARTTLLDVKCDLHDTSFVATPRGLLNTSTEYSETTCRFCEREAGVGRNFTTLGEAQRMIAESEEFDWVLDAAQLPEELRDPNRIVMAHEHLPLRCKRLGWGSAEPCGVATSHSWANIGHTLGHNTDHLHCGGTCDSKRKGKSRRRPVESLEADLRKRRSGTWRLSDRKRYRKASEPQWFSHVCGNKVFRAPEKILNFPDASGLEPATNEDCPFCTQSSPLGCLNGSVAEYRHWVKLITDGKVKYRGRSFPKSADEPLDLKCSCGTPYEASQYALQKNVHFGCPTCEEKGRSAQRAWSLEAARSVVARRGFVLQGDPGSYVAEAVIQNTDGSKSSHHSILELVQALPGSANGFGIQERRKWATPRLGMPYSHEDVAFLRKHQSTMRHAQLAEALGRTEGSVKQQFRRLGIRNDEREHFKRTVEVRDGAFDVLSPESCYWAGLLATDGCITDKGEISLELAIGDEDVLQGLAAFLGHTGHLSYRTVTNTDGRGLYAKLRFRSSQIRQALMTSFGIIPRKTRILPAPNLSDSPLCRAYMVGLIEGDGHIKRDRRGGLMINFVSASPSLFEWFVRQVEIIIGKRLPTRTVGKYRVTSSITIWNNDAELLMSSLLADFQGNMHRKWNN